MSCRAEIFTAIKDDSLAVPIQAIIVEEDIAEGETTYRVFLAQGESAVEREVEVGLSDDTYWEIVSGLSGGETIVIGPDRVLRNLENGDQIVANDQD
jgi:HlyD family secretion protein